MKHNLLTSHLNIHPIIQAPMAGVSTPSLAAAVSNAGALGSIALGSIALGASNIHQAELLLKETEKLTDKPFNVNLFCHKPPERDEHKEKLWLDFLDPLFKALGGDAPSFLNETYQSFILNNDMFLLLLKHKPKVISFHFGLPPTEWINRFKDEGIFLIATATNLQEAKQIEIAGVNAIVAQGIEAGGHRGTFDTSIKDDKLKTADLVNLLVANTSLPIIAAGGIMNGKHINHFMDLGASAAQLGTAFITCPESAASQKYRDMLLSGRNAETVLIEGISGRAARGLSNKLTSYLESTYAPSIPDYPLAYDVAKKLSLAALDKGIGDYTAYWFGEGVSFTRELVAKQLVEALILEMNTRE